MKIHEKYQYILDQTEPFLLGNPDNFSAYALEVFEKSFAPENLKSCLELRNQKFFSLVQRLDSLTFGDQGMGMDKWVFFDCSAMPAGIFGFGIQRERLPKEFLELMFGSSSGSISGSLKFDDSYDGLVPISMYMCIPTSDGGRWFGHNLSSLNSFLGHAYPGLGLLTKAFACRVFGVGQCYGATQWGSSALEIHTQLGDMLLKAATLPAHTHSNSLCYISDYCEENILLALSGKKRVANNYDQLLGAKDILAQEKLHMEIEKGLEVAISGRPIRREGEEGIFYPLRILS